MRKLYILFLITVAGAFIQGAAALGLGDRRALESYQQTVYPAQLAAIQKAVGFELPIEVHWDAIAKEGEGANYQHEGYWTKIYFVPLIEALSKVAGDDMGKQAVKGKLKKVIVTFDDASAPSTAYINGVKFDGGVLTINFRPFTNVDDVKDRAEAIQLELEGKL